MNGCIVGLGEFHVKIYSFPLLPFLIVRKSAMIFIHVHTIFLSV